MLWLGGSTGCRDLAPFPRGVNAWASSLSSLSCISRNIKVLKKKIKKFKAVPDDSLPVRLKLRKPGSKLWPDLMLLIQTLQLCFCWTDLLPFLPSHLLLITCATDFAHYGKNSCLQFLRGDLAAAERELPEMAWSYDRISLVPALPTALCPGCWGIAWSHSFMGDPSLAVSHFTPGLERLH